MKPEPRRDDHRTLMIPTPEGVIVVEDPLPEYVAEPGVPGFFQKLHEQSVLDFRCPWGPIVRRLDLYGYDNALEAISALRINVKEGPLPEYLANEVAFPLGRTKICAGFFEPPAEPLIGFKFIFGRFEEDGRLGSGTVWFGHPLARDFVAGEIREFYQEYRRVVCKEGA